MIRQTTFLLLVAICCQYASAEPQGEQNEDVAAIRKTVASYVEAFNKGDAKAVASHWNEKGEWISPSGQRFQGRTAIEAEMKSYFTESKGGQRIEISNSNVRLLAATVGIEEGTASVIQAGGGPNETSYIAIHIKKNGQWKLDSVRETTIPPVQPIASSNYEHLKDLEWMIGTWVDGDKQSSIETTCNWIKNKNYMMRTFTVKLEGRVEMEGTQIIGWDASEKRIRTWIFDSNGGFGEGEWTKNGNQWSIKASHVLQNGDKASSINIITIVDSNSFTWQSVGREINGELLPNIEAVTIVRKR